MNKYTHRHQFRSSEKQRPRQDSTQERFIGRILWRVEVKTQGRQAVFRQWRNPATIKGEGKEGGLVGKVRLLCQSKKVWTTPMGPLEESHLRQEWAHTFLVSHWLRKTQADGFSRNMVENPKGQPGLSLTMFPSRRSGLCSPGCRPPCTYMLLNLCCFFWCHFPPSHLRSTSTIRIAPILSFSFAHSLLTWYSKIDNSYNILCVWDFLLSSIFVLWLRISIEMVCHLFKWQFPSLSIRGFGKEAPSQLEKEK